jgi:hypothetical protein
LPFKEIIPSRKAAGNHSTDGAGRDDGTHRVRINRMAVADRTGLTIKGIVRIDDWRELGEQIFVISESSSWWLGDWLLYGQNKYPERYKQAITETSLDYQTLRNYAWVARRFDQSRRRRGLSFQHHVEVAALPDEEQDLWLERAEKLAWSRNELRARVRASRAGKEVEPSEPLAIVIDVDKDRKARWMHAAQRSSVDLFDWIGSCLDAAATAALEG